MPLYIENKDSIYIPVELVPVDRHVKGVELTEEFYDRFNRAWRELDTVMKILATTRKEQGV